ncbi:CapA family protein [Soonwooa sp.]|uniref:CapA family protein n=2 Tax=Soonwooa sp. TaxID=1938592 RepID=UPI0028A67500|nr:CapA family protein [Soonwooa sp.]
MKIFISGDFCPINRIQSFIEEDRMEDVYNDMLPILQDVDYAVTNLECPLTTSDKAIIKSGAAIKSTPDSIKLLKKGGFNLVTLANNHILDYGGNGVMDSIKLCHQNNIATVGAGKNLDEAKKAFFIKHGDLKIGFYNVAENEFGNTYGESPGANPLDPIQNSYDIKDAKEKCDYLLVIVHGGREHYQLPSPKTKQRYRFFIDCGADAVVAHHPHCYSGFEYYQEKPIFYSLGNFIFDYKKKYQKGMWTEAYAVIFDLSAEKLDFEIIAYKQGREEDPTIRLLNDEESEAFHGKLNDLNVIINNEELLLKEWRNYVEKEKVNYKSNLLIQNKYIRELIKRNFIPKAFLHSKEHQVLLLNLLRCEAHREIMTDVLSTELEK